MSRLLNGMNRFKCLNFPLRSFTSRATTNKNNSLVNILSKKIKFTGPITVSEYMKECLTNPQHGYYMNRDVFGENGDFITSPEISQMFGELIGIWCVNEWMKAGSPPKMNIVEFGPGRGSLADDMLRVFYKFPELKEVISLHLIEISSKMRQLQSEKLRSISSNQLKYDFPIFWHNDICEIPKTFTCFIAHEFFDALPIHIFHKNDETQDWCEVMVDIDQKDNLQFVKTRTPTPASKLYNLNECSNNRRYLEYSPDTGIVIEQMAKVLNDQGGFGLLVDYGHMGNKEDTLRGFEQHKVKSPLDKPGLIDLTADVDFLNIKTMAMKNNISVHGPITQSTFLERMGISMRLEILLQDADENTKKTLQSGYDMITNQKGMGSKFNFMALSSLKNYANEYIPVGFEDD